MAGLLLDVMPQTQFKLNTMTDVGQCHNAQITWSGGTSPYTVYVVHTNGTVLVNFGQRSWYSFTGIAKVRSGTPIHFMVTDATGSSVMSPPLTVKESTTSTCFVNTDPPGIDGGLTPEDTIPTSVDPEPTSAVPDRSSTSRPRVAKIVGGTIGGLLLIIILCLLVFFIRRRRKPQSQIGYTQSEMGRRTPKSGFASFLRRVIGRRSDTVVIPFHVPPREDVSTPTKQLYTGQLLDNGQSTMSTAHVQIHVTSSNGRKGINKPLPPLVENSLDEMPLSEAEGSRSLPEQPPPDARNEALSLEQLDLIAARMVRMLRVPGQGANSRNIDTADLNTSRSPPSPSRNFAGSRFMRGLSVSVVTTRSEVPPTYEE